METCTIFSAPVAFFYCYGKGNEKSTDLIALFYCVRSPPRLCWTEMVCAGIFRVLCSRKLQMETIMWKADCSESW